MNASRSSNRLLHTAVARPLSVILTVALALAAGCAGSRASSGGADASPTAGAPGHPSEGAGAAESRGPDAAPVRRSLVLLGTADLRGHADPRHDETGRETDYGLARLKPLVDSVREANPGRVLLFDSGDLIAGNTLTFEHPLLSGDEDPQAETRGQPTGGGPGLALAAGDRMGNAPHPVIRAMNVMEYDAAVVGDRDVYAGIEPLDRTVHDAAFPFLAANVFEAGMDRHAYHPSALIPHVVAQGDTIRIGVTGASPPGLHLRAPDLVGDRLEFRDAIPSVRPEVRRLREQGADLVVVLLHGDPDGADDPGRPGDAHDAGSAGGADIAGDAIDHGGGSVRNDTGATGVRSGNGAARLAREVPGVDVILVGHAHRESADTVVNGVLLSWAEDRARSLAAVTVELTRRAPNDWRVSAREAALLRPDPVRADTALLASLRRAHERGLGRLMADAQRRATDANIGIVDTRAIRAGLRAMAVARDGPDPLRPSANELMRLHLTGGQLRTVLERALAGERPDAYASGVLAWYDPTRPSGNRILTLELDDGRPVRPDRVYTVAVPASMADPDRGESVFGHALGREATGIADLDALREYLETASDPVSATTGPRLRRVRPSDRDPASDQTSAANDETSKR